MDSQEINASRRRFLTAMLAVGAASACAVPADQKRGLPVKIQNSGFSPVRIMALLKQK